MTDIMKLSMNIKKIIKKQNMPEGTVERGYINTCIGCGVPDSKTGLYVNTLKPLTFICLECSKKLKSSKVKNKSLLDAGIPSKYSDSEIKPKLVEFLRKDRLNTVFCTDQSLNVKMIAGFVNHLFSKKIVTFKYFEQTKLFDNIVQYSKIDGYYDYLPVYKTKILIINNISLINKFTVPILEKIVFERWQHGRFTLLVFSANVKLLKTMEYRFQQLINKGAKINNWKVT